MSWNIFEHRIFFQNINVPGPYGPCAYGHGTYGPGTYGPGVNSSGPRAEAKISKKHSSSPSPINVGGLGKVSDPLVENFKRRHLHVHF